MSGHRQQHRLVLASLAQARTFDLVPPRMASAAPPGVKVLDERNLWLAKAVRVLRQYFSECGLRLPDNITVSVDDTTVAGDGAVGLCYPSTSTPEGVPAVVISPTLQVEVQVVPVLVHELVHAADDCQSLHGPWFAAWATELGLVGEGFNRFGSNSELRRFVHRMLMALGSYPRVGAQYLAYPNGRIIA